MQPDEVVIATNQIAINENLREYTAATALSPGLKSLSLSTVELVGIASRLSSCVAR